MDMDWKGLERKFPDIKAFVKNDKGVDNKQDQDRFVDFLNDLGVMLHYGKHSILTDLNILNPEWVTNGVYAIINDPGLLRKRNGILSINDLNFILDAKKYPPERYKFILAMMRKFELCFEFEGSRGEKFLLPDLLSEEEKDTGKWEDALAFQYHYDVLPGSIITRFIVRMHSYISKNTYWRNGVVLVSEDGRNRSLVRADEDEGIITIRIDGPEAGRRGFLDIIRADFRKIHSSPTRKGVDERVPLPGNLEITVQYNHLLDMEKNQVLEFMPEGTTKMHNVKELLDGIEEPITRQQRGPGFDNKTTPEPETSKPKARGKIAYLWGVGSFWLAAFLAIFLVIFMLGEKRPWYYITGSIGGTLLVLALIGILTSLFTGELSEKGFLKVLKDFYKNLNFLKKLKSQEDTQN